MSHTEQRNFIQKTKDHFPEFFDNVNVVEIGSLNINGTVRDFFSGIEYPKSYVGMDLMEGKDVDIVCKGKDYKIDYVDMVISTECFEHDKDWIDTFQNMIRMCKSRGMVLFTCASEGRHEHGTTRTTPENSPATTDYYKNLIKKDFTDVFGFERIFEKHLFEYNPITCDLYFWGIKK